MTGYVTFGGEERGLTANGLSPVLYRAIFREDFLTERVKCQNDGGGLVELYGKMAFVMQKQHETEQKNISKLFKLTDKDYFTWLVGLYGADIENNLDKIVNIYGGNEVTMSDPKESESDKP